MPSERRLHPTTILFGLVGQLREFALPIVALLVAGSSRGTMDTWALVLIGPYSLLAILRYVTFSYDFDATELVIRSGIIGRNERHIPYARIQNLDASQNVFHRMLGVLAARIDTGSGSDAEATLSVITRDAYEELRRHVFAAREAEADAAASPPPAEAPLLHLPTRDLVIHGLVDNRGMIVIAGLLGLLFQSGLDDRLVAWLELDRDSGRNVVQVLMGLVSERAEGLHPIATALVVIVGALGLIRLLSVAIALVRLHDFTLTRVGEDLRAEYGLFTRISSTIPLRRVQTVTVSETLLHRVFGRASIRVDTAGGEGGQVQQRTRESLAPILPAGRVPDVLAAVLPELRLGHLDWQRAAPGAVAREFRQRLVLSTIGAALAAYPLGWYSLAVFAAFASLSWITARRAVAGMGWATVDGAVLYRSGYIGRRMTIARFSRIQAVTIVASPFDRRRRMAQVHVDTAGAAGAPHRVHIPYVARDEASSLHARLAAAASQTTFQW